MCLMTSLQRRSSVVSSAVNCAEQAPARILKAEEKVEGRHVEVKSKVFVLFETSRLYPVSLKLV